MSIGEIIVIGIGLSMDAVAVTLGNSMAYTKEKKGKLLLMPLFFGFFQALMPIIGYFAGSLFSGIITRYSGIVVFIILGFIGGKMLYDGIKDLRHPDEEKTAKSLTLKLLLLQAIATSIDAFAVGIGFSATGANVFLSAGIIGLTTCVCTIAALYIGKAAGKLLGSKAEIFGGIILLIIAVKSLFA